MLAFKRIRLSYDYALYYRLIRCKTLQQLSNLLIILQPIIILHTIPCQQTALRLFQVILPKLTASRLTKKGNRVINLKTCTDNA